MPNKKVHVGTGLAVIVVITLLAGIQFLEKYLLHAIVFIIATMLPDIIEPPSSYKHRAFFHSWIFMAFLIIGVLVTLILGLTNQQFFLITAFCVGYMLHLFCDAYTPMGLPFI
jgi:hypothetical protein